MYYILIIDQLRSLSLEKLDLMFGRNKKNPVDGGVEKKRPSSVRFEIDVVNVN